MTVDPTIEADSLPIHTTRYSVIRLMNDSRWPWLIVLPRTSKATELHHLNEPQKSAFLDDITILSELVQQQTHCKSVNIAMLGNVVCALHCHIVARNIDDPNWPAPVWGFEKAIPYTDDMPKELITEVQNEF